MTGMLQRVMVVVLFGCVGLAAGVAVTTFGPRSYIVGWAFLLPRHSDGLRLAAIARSQHVQGVRVKFRLSRGGGGELDVLGHGSRDGATRAANAVATQVLRAIKRMPSVWQRFLAYRNVPAAHALARPQGNAVLTGALGLLAGLSAALGFLVPPRSRLTRR